MAIRWTGVADERPTPAAAGCAILAALTLAAVVIGGFVLLALLLTQAVGR